MARHATRTTNMDKAIGITAIVLGILVLVGQLTFTWLVPFLGAILLIVGILALMDVVKTSRLVAVVFIVVGVLLLINLLGIPEFLARVLDIVVGVVLIVVGVMRLT
jgi:hypothetical protein